MQAIRPPSIPPREWSARMRHLVRTCVAYPYAFLHLWDGD
ncbi:hypothetical protein MSKU15_2340 [Komagataeibacter diospyri]|uniref:Uncharacterized protein n=1 Tax=Komagataeibacter diospyri TaxID=1932662 RepID=A0A4P5NW59_9PROT|nr:hypothetical protein MSKU9_1976 [Komagataeibacter diospyri]GCE90739.1 hypothetical protein MSKU15_2340 [Komagataeibacter diospyri]